MKSPNRATAGGTGGDGSGAVRIRTRFPLYIERRIPSAVAPPIVPQTPPAAPVGPTGLDFVYRTSVEALTAQERAISSLDARAGVLIGITATAFGLIATNSGTSGSLFAEHADLATISLFTLALVILGLVGVVLVRNVIEFPGVPTLIERANETESRIKELSLSGLQQAWQRNRQIIIWKARLLLSAQVLIVVFVLIVVAFRVPDLGHILGAAWNRL